MFKTITPCDNCSEENEQLLIIIGWYRDYLRIWYKNVNISEHSMEPSEYQDLEADENIRATQGEKDLDRA